MNAAAADHLLVDMGNQRLKWRRMPAGGEDRAVPAAGGVVSLNRQDDPEQAPLERRLERAFTGAAVPRRILLSAVSQDGAVADFRAWCERRWGVAVESVESVAEYDGFINDYDQPAQLGCDRWLAALAASRLIRQDNGSTPVVVVDAGTALTVDLVHRNHFCGGVIMPGYLTMVRMLGRDTGRIRLQAPIDGSHRGAVVATNSDDAVRSGSFNAVCGGMDRCIDEIRVRVGDTPRVLFTGGDGGLVQGGSRFRGDIRENLVLDGLAIVAGGNAR